MQNKPSEKPTTPQSPKRPYQTPTLTDLGTVAQLTQGGTGAGAEPFGSS